MAGKGKGTGTDARASGANAVKLNLPAPGSRGEKLPGDCLFHGHGRFGNLHKLFELGMKLTSNDWHNPCPHRLPCLRVEFPHALARGDHHSGTAVSKGRKHVQARLHSLVRRSHARSPYQH